MRLHHPRRHAARTARPLKWPPPLLLSLLQGVSMPPPETRGFFFQQVETPAVQPRMAGWAGRQCTPGEQTPSSPTCRLVPSLLPPSLPSAVQTMLRIWDPAASLDFYTRVLGMT